MSKLESAANWNSNFNGRNFSTDSFNFNSEDNSDATTVNVYNKRVRTTAPSQDSNRMQLDNTSPSFSYKSQQPVDSTDTAQIPTSTVVSSHDPVLGERLDSLESTASKIMNSMSQFSQMLSGHSFSSDSSNTGSGYNPPAPRNDQ